MQRNAALLTTVCIMMCLTFNYTFPLHRKIPDSGTSKSSSYPNKTPVCTLPEHQETMAERTKKMATNIEQALKKFKDSTSGFGKNIYDHVSSGIKEHINFISEDDLRQYEQMVIMKKYPYLDFKELELKLSPSKNTRQSIKLAHGCNTENEQHLVEDSPNVEIINRGLSGFAIPPELSKHVSSIVDNKARTSAPIDNNKREDIVKLSKKSPVNDAILGSLKNFVQEYVEKKSVKL